MLEILTPRLCLRVPQLDDASEVNRAKNEIWPVLQLYMSWAHDGEQTLAATRGYIESVPAIHAKGGIQLFGFCRETGQFVIALGTMCHKGIPEAGYWVARDFEGKGYATEATTALCYYGFAVLNYRQIHINHYGGNDKSRRVIEKLGFIPLCILKNDRRRCLDGAPVDLHCYKIVDPRHLPDLDVSVNGERLCKPSTRNRFLTRCINAVRRGILAVRNRKLSRWKKPA